MQPTYFYLDILMVMLQIDNKPVRFLLSISKKRSLQSYDFLNSQLSKSYALNNILHEAKYETFFI